MTEPLLIAKNKTSIHLLPSDANRHDLIAGATGTGKTATPRFMAERLDAIGNRLGRGLVREERVFVESPPGDRR